MNVSRSVAIARSPRVAQLEGMFDIPPAERVERTWDVDLPLGEREWQIGMLVGPSGSGKSTLLADLFAVPAPHAWPSDAAVIDGFDPALSIKAVTAALSSVGFSSPPAWLRPYAVLSGGERFRADLARSLLEAADVAVIDEFTSVVDRTVAKVASAAVAKHVRRGRDRLVVASCHYDVEEWLQPDWVFDTGSGVFCWRCLQRRPPIELEIYRTTAEAWRVFHPHHYLSGDLHKAACCYVALVDGTPAAFVSVLHFPHPRAADIWKEHRTVCLPDFQGVGIGNAASETIASLYVAKGCRYRSVTSSPAMIAHRARSALWLMDRKPGAIRPSGRTSSVAGIVKSALRYTASFEYVGPAASPEHVLALCP